jgi:hypothetical protein
MYVCVCLCVCVCVCVCVSVSVCPSDYDTYRDALGDAAFTRITSTPRLTPRLARAAEWIAAANSQHQLPRTPRSSIPYSGAEMHARERAASEMHYNVRELAHEQSHTPARRRAASEMNSSGPRTHQSVNSELVCVNGDGEVLGVMLLQSLYIMQDIFVNNDTNNAGKNLNFSRSCEGSLLL